MKQLIRKKSLLGLSLFVLSLCASFSHSDEIVDFSNGLPNGMSIGGAMSDAFPGYITDNQYDKSSSIVFANPTPVSSFELNPLPYAGYPFDIVLSDYQIKGIDAEGNVAFELEVDLSGYTDWETWLTVQVDNSIAITELVFGPAVTEMYPSIDNLVVDLANEVDDVDADFAEYNCQVYGNCGDNDSEVEPFEDAIFICEYGCDDEEFVAYNCEVYGVCLDNDATNTETGADPQTETQIEINTNTNTDPVIFIPTTSGSVATPETEFGYQVVDFSNGFPNGMSIGGAMSDAFPGYITDNQYDKSSSIVFANPTPVSSFELNPLPYAGYPFDIVLSDYQIKGIDAEGNVAFELEVDLSGYTDWETWLTVQVDNSIAITELVFGPAVTEMYPSIDNLVVDLANEVDDVDADFAEYNCQVYGNCGDNDSEVEPFEDAIFVCEYGCDDEEFVAYNCEVYGVCLDNDATNTETSADSQTETQTNSDTTTEPELGYQLVSVEGNPIAQLNDTLEISISYDVSDDNNSLSGLGFNIHYDSSVLSFNEFIYLLADDSIISSVSVDDINDLDNDSSTDKYISLGWASFFSAWPGFLPQSLASISFNVTEQTDLQLTPINFSATGTAAGYSFSAENYAVEVINATLEVDGDADALTEEVLNATWDIDGNGRADALTDGLMLLKASFGFTGEGLIDGTLAADSGMTLEDVEANMENTMTIADIDDDGEVNALTDGVILLRYLFGITDSTLTEGAIGPNAQRDTHQSIVDYLDENMPEME
jgi:hypothetical protein